MKTLKLFATVYELPYWDLLPPLSAALFAELKQSIKEDGQQVPILLVNKVGSDSQPAPRVIDGGHRLLALVELVSEGVEVKPYFRTAYNLSPEKERQLALDLNLKRRQLSVEERQEIALRLRQDQKSYREIGEALGVDAATAYRDVKKATVANATVELPSTIVGKDGSERAASVPRLSISNPEEKSGPVLFDEAIARKEEKLFTPPVVEALENFSEFGQEEPSVEEEIECARCVQGFTDCEHLQAVSNCGEHPVYVPTEFEQKSSELFAQIVDEYKTTGKDPVAELLASSPKVETPKGAPTIKASGYEGWNTPPHIIALLNLFALFGKVSLDPCSNDDSQVKAHVELDLVDDGLHADWAAELQAVGHEGGLVFVNPPYDWETLEHVAKKCSEEAINHHLEIISLVPNKSDQDWFQDEVMPFASAICYLRGRVKFYRNGEESSGAALSSVLFYWGKDAPAFCEMFAPLGRCLDLDLQRKALERLKEEAA